MTTGRRVCCRLRLPEAKTRDTCTRLTMNYKRYLVPLGTWLALVLGIVYLAVFLVLGGRENFAVATSMFALSLSVKTYGTVLAGKRHSSQRD